jgi:hypothetical protein
MVLGEIGVEQVAAFASARVARSLLRSSRYVKGAALFRFDLDHTPLYSLCWSFENGRRWETVSIEIVFWNIVVMPSEAGKSCVFFRTTHVVFTTIVERLREFYFIVYCLVCLSWRVLLCCGVHLIRRAEALLCPAFACL